MNFPSASLTSPHPFQSCHCAPFPCSTRASLCLPRPSASHSRLLSLTTPHCPGPQPHTATLPHLRAFAHAAAQQALPLPPPALSLLCRVRRPQPLCPFFPGETGSAGGTAPHLFLDCLSSDHRCLQGCDTPCLPTAPCSQSLCWELALSSYSVNIK